MGNTFNTGRLINGLFVDASGNVGINNTSPSYALDIYNKGNNIAIRVYQPSATTSNYNTIYFTGNHTAAVGYIGTGGSAVANGALQNAYYLGTQTAHPIVFTTSDTGRMLITSGGNVGINTTNPTSQLMVYGGANTATFVNTNSASNSNVQLGNNNTTNGAGMALFGSTYSSNAQYRQSGAYFYSNQSGGFTIHAEGNNSIHLATNNSQRIIIDGGGDVYFGNTNTPLNLKPENTPATVITNLASAGATYNFKPGVYWIGYGGNTFLAYVRFNWHQGRNWVLALKCHNVHDMPSGSPLWQNNTLINQSDFNLHSGRMAKYPAWNHFPFTRLLYEMGNKIPPIMQWNSSKTSLFSVLSGISIGNGSGVGCDSTDPQISTTESTTYYGMANFLGGNFNSAYGGAEVNINYYGLGSFANTASNSTVASNTGSSAGFGVVTEHLGSFSNLQSIGRAGAWIGCPLDEGGHVFNAASSPGADSGFGLGVSGGNSPRTTTSGIISWALGSSVANYLPAYVWLSID